jgi:hypothetical protein
MLTCGSVALLMGEVVATGLAAGGCNESCSAAGCESGVSVEFKRLERELPDASTIKVCVERGCGVTKGGMGELTGSLAMSVQDPNEREVPVSVRVRDDSGRELAQASTRVDLVKFQPNGPDCEPTCYSAALVYDAESGALTVQDAGRGSA